MDVKIKIMKEVKPLRVDGKPVPQQPIVFREPWAKMKKVQSDEDHADYDAKLNRLIAFEVRYCKSMEEMMDLKPFYVVFKGRRYNIEDIDFGNYGKTKVTLTCKAVS